MPKYFSDTDLNIVTGIGLSESNLHKKHRFASSIFYDCKMFALKINQIVGLWWPAQSFVVFKIEKERPWIKISLPDTMNHFPFHCCKDDSAKLWKAVKIVSWPFIHS